MSDTKKEIAVYIRVSTSGQAREGLSLEYQEELGKRHGATRVYGDVRSGWERRAGYQALLADLDAGILSRVLLPYIDRSSRRLREVLELIERCEARGIELVDLQTGIDLASDDGWLHGVFGGLGAELENRRKRRRSQNAWEYKRRTGAGKRAPWGFRMNPQSRKLEIIPELQAQARQIVEVFLQEQSTWRAATRLREEGVVTWHPNTLLCWLISEVLAGDTGYWVWENGQRKEQVVHRNTHTPLISREEQERIQQIIRWNRKHRGRVSQWEKHPLAGLLSCAGCQHTLILNRKLRPHDCQENFRCKYVHCRLPRTRIPTRVLWEQLWSHLVELADRIPIELPEPDKVDPEIQQLQAQIRYLQDSPLPVPGLDQIIESLQAQVEALRIERGSATARQYGDLERLRPHLRDPDFWRSLPDPILREELRLLIRRAWVASPHGIVRIEWQASWLLPSPGSQSEGSPTAPPQDAEPHT